MKLSTWIRQYRALREQAGLSDGTLRLDRQTADRFSAFVGPTARLASIKPARIDDWKAAMQAEGLSGSSVHGHLSRVSAMFERAVRREIIDRNPAAAVPNPAPVIEHVQPIVEHETMGRVIAACENPGLAAIVGLCGYAGLRLEEARSVKWGDVVWPASDEYLGKIIVRTRGGRVTTKNRHREPPMIPELAALLDGMEQGEPDRRVSLGAPTNPRRSLDAAIRRAGLEPWSAPFQHLRFSRNVIWREIDLHDEHDVVQWIGNSVAVNRRHYRPSRRDQYRAESPRAAMEREIAELRAMVRRETA